MIDSNTILIVDDELDVCWALEYIMHKGGFHTVKSFKAWDALCLLRETRFQAVFIDAKLPDIDGIELARQIRQIDSDVRIIMVSGYFYQDDISVQQAIAQGLISAFISKPFLQEEIMNALQR